jgi:hypothetical protein
MPIRSDIEGRDFNETGALGMLAPEQYYTNPTVIKDASITEKTTVFHLGYIMHKFIHCHKNPREPLHVRIDTKRGFRDETVWR